MINMETLEIKSRIVKGGLQIRPVKVEDLEAIHLYACNPNVKKYIGWQLKASLEDTNSLIQTMLDREVAGTHAYASLVEIESNLVVGTLMIFGADWSAGHCEIGYVLSEAVWNKGYGTEIVKSLIEDAVDTLGFRKVFARVISANVGSIRVLEKNGFTVEAVLKDYYFINNELCDCIFLSYKQ